MVVDGVVVGRFGVDTAVRGGDESWLHPAATSDATTSATAASERLTGR